MGGPSPCKTMTLQRNGSKSLSELRFQRKNVGSCCVVSYLNVLWKNTIMHKQRNLERAHTRRKITSNLNSSLGIIKHDNALAGMSIYIFQTACNDTLCPSIFYGHQSFQCLLILLHSWHAQATSKGRGIPFAGGCLCQVASPPSCLAGAFCHEAK